MNYLTQLCRNEKKQKSELANNVYQRRNQQETIFEEEDKSLETAKSVFLLYRYALAIIAVVAIVGMAAFLLFNAQSVYTAKLIPAFAIIVLAVLQHVVQTESK